MMKLYRSLAGHAVALLIGFIGISAGNTEPLGTAFSYQGHLAQDGQPANGQFDFEFRLYDLDTGGMQLGMTVAIDDVQVTDGFFSVELDYGAVPFAGERIWVEVSVSEAGAGNFFQLLPRQELKPNPFSLYSRSVEMDSIGGNEIADNAVGVTEIDSSQVQARVAANCGSGSSIRSIGSDGAVVCETDDDTTYGAGFGLTETAGVFDVNSTTVQRRVGGTCPQGEMITRIQPDGSVDCARTRPQSVLVVDGGGNGDYQTIQAALSAIGTTLPAATATNPYLVWVAPGVYSETIQLEPFVRVSGAGEALTKITSAGFSSSSTGTVVGADNSELLDLTVENTGGSSHATAVYNSAASPRLTRVTLVASGGTTASYAVYNAAGAAPALNHVTASADGVGAAKAMFNGGGSSPIVSNSSLRASGCITAICYATDSRSGAMPVFKNVTATASAGGSVSAVAFFANAGSVLTLEHSTGSAVDGTANSGMLLISASAVVRHSRLEGDDSGGGTGRGIALTGTTDSYSVTVDHSVIIGADNTIKGASAFSVMVGSSLLDGGMVDDGGGSVTCAGVYNEAYVFSASTCP